MTAPANFIGPVTAYKWQCEQCHDSGLERDKADAARAYDDHRDDYHAPSEPVLHGLDQLDPADADAFLAAWNTFRSDE